MKRKSLYTYAAAFIVLAVLLIIAVADYYYIASQNERLAAYKEQQREFVRIITLQYLPDMEAARDAWIAANPRDHAALQDQGISVEADSITTSEFTVILDLQDPAMATLDSTTGKVAPGNAVVYLGQYYDENMTRIPGWAASYTVNTTSHAVSGLTSSLVENVAHGYYASDLAGTIYRNLGVSNGTVTGSSSRSVDCSYLPESGNWMDVTEYEYALKNTDLKSFLLVKTYVNATDQSVTGVDISQPYRDSVTGFVDISQPYQVSVT